MVVGSGEKNQTFEGICLVRLLNPHQLTQTISKQFSDPIGSKILHA